jgi:hypothetical protein
VGTVSFPYDLPVSGADPSKAVMQHCLPPAPGLRQRRHNVILSRRREIAADDPHRQRWEAFGEKQDLTLGLAFSRRHVCS